MLRLIALILLLANGLYFAWGHGYLRDAGLGPLQQSEPQRLAQQIAPTSVRVMGVAEFEHVQAQIKAEQEAKECLQAGPLDAAQSAATRQALEPALPAGSWALEEAPLGARWIVYLGKYPSAESVAKRRAELLALHFAPEALNNPALEPGLALGGFATRPEALALLAQVKARGLQVARVVQERAPGVAYWLKVPAANAALKSQLLPLQSAWGQLPLQACN